MDHACNPGTVNKVEGASSIDQCLSCGAGLYCESFANRIGGSKCLPGFFCQSDSNTRSPNKEYDTRSGAFAGRNTALWTQPQPVVVAPNVHINYFYGYDTTALPVTDRNDICQPGSWSLEGARLCTTCSGGKYCPNEWMKDETGAGSCRAGFYCVTGVTKPTPNNPLAFPPFIASSIMLTPATNAINKIEVLETTTKGDVCPAGNYCETGSNAPKSCDPGFFLSYKGATAQAKCISCPTGLFCGTPATTNPYRTLATDDFFSPIQNTYFCKAGFFCQGGSSLDSATPCLQDHYCVAGTRSMQPCAPSEYTEGMRASVCLTCTGGNYCVGQNGQVPCSFN